MSSFQKFPLLAGWISRLVRDEAPLGDHQIQLLDLFREVTNGCVDRLDGLPGREFLNLFRCLKSVAGTNAGEGSFECVSRPLNLSSVLLPEGSLNFLHQPCRLCGKEAKDFGHQGGVLA